MSTIVDELIITLGLDPSDFNKGQKEAVREWQKTRDEMVKRSKEMEEQGKHLNEQISTLTTRFTALFGVLLGGKSMVGFAEQTTQAAIALRNLGEQLGMTPQRLSQYQQTMEALGASQESVNTAFARFGDEIQKFKRGEGSADFLRLLQMLHISPSSILKERPEQIFSDIQKALRQPGIDLQSAESMARALGIPQDAIVAMRSPDWEKRFAAAGKTAYSAEDVKTAEQLNAAWVTMRQNMEALARVILNDVAPVIEKVLDHIKGLAENKEYGQLAAEGLGVLAVGALGIRKVIGGIFGGLFGGAKAAALPAAGVGVGWIGRLLGVGAVTTMAQDTENAYGPGGKPQETFFPHKWILAWNKLFGRDVPNAPDQPNVSNAPDRSSGVKTGWWDWLHWKLGTGPGPEQQQPYGFDEGQKRWSPLGGASKDIRADVEEPVRKGMLAALREFFGLGTAGAAELRDSFSTGGSFGGGFWNRLGRGGMRRGHTAAQVLADRAHGGMRRGHGGHAGAEAIGGGGGGMGVRGAGVNDRALRLMNRLVGKGWTPEAAASAAAEAYGESAITAGGPRGDAGASSNMFQWDARRYSGFHGDPKNFDQVVDFFDEERKRHGQVNWHKARTVEEGILQGKDFEQYGDKSGHTERYRAGLARSFLNLYRRGGASGGDVTTGKPTQGGMRPGGARFIPPVGVDSSHDKLSALWHGGGNAAPAGVMGLAAGAKLAGVSNSRHTVHNNQSEVAIQSMHIHSSSRDAQELAGDIKPAFDRLALASHANFSHV